MKAAQRLLSPIFSSHVFFASPMWWVAFFWPCLDIPQLSCFAIGTDRSVCFLVVFSEENSRSDVSPQLAARRRGEVDFVGWTGGGQVEAWRKGRNVRKGTMCQNLPVKFVIIFERKTLALLLERVEENDRYGGQEVQNSWKEEKREQRKKEGWRPVFYD